MKLFIGSLFLFFGCFGFGQDTLILKTGQIKAVKIISVSEKGEVKYSEKGKEKSLSKFEIISFSHNSLWYTNTSDSENYSETSTSLYDFHFPKFMEKSEQNTNKLSLSVNLGAPIASVDMFKTRQEYFDEGNYQLYNNNIGKLNLSAASNRTFSFSIDYRFHEKLSIGVPVRIGFDFKNQSELILNDGSNYYFTYSNYVQGEFFNWELKDNGLEFTPELRMYYFQDAAIGTGHTNQLIFETGVNPKFYFLGQKKFSPFISQSLLVGLGDQYKVNYYVVIDTIASFDPYSHNEHPEWEIQSERAEMVSNKQFFFRSETSFGIDVALTKNWSLAGEIGYMIVKYASKTEDDIFVKLIDGDFEYNTSITYNPIYSRIGSMICRAHLIYKFSGKN